jgi:hypothetical protein
MGLRDILSMLSWLYPNLDFHIVIILGIVFLVREFVSFFPAKKKNDEN